MENNKLIKTDGLFSKIKEFFAKLFNNKTKKDINYSPESSNSATISTNKENRYFKSLRESYEQEKDKQELANELIYGGLGVNDLTDDEVDEMAEYIKQDIQNIDDEITRRKQHIVEMQQELKKQNA